MARLYRPHIPLSVKVAVACHQLGLDVDSTLDLHGSNGAALEMLLPILAAKLGCEVGELRLDHDPPLGARVKIPDEWAARWLYIPDANDPEHLKYRPHGAQHAGSHDVKTRIRGEHGQFSDVALIKRERRRERKKNPTARQARLADLREKQRKLRRELRRKLARKAGKRPKQRWQSRPLGGKKSPRRFGGE